MQRADTLIRTKLRLPFTRPELIPRPRLQARIIDGLCRPLTLVTAPAGFGKTTLVASCVADCGMPVAWLSLDRDDNQAERFLNYLVAALQGAANTVGNEAAQLMAGMQQAPPEAALTSLINDLDSANVEITLVLDDYQFISSQVVHEQVAFLLEHWPNCFFKYDFHLSGYARQHYQSGSVYVCLDCGCCSDWVADGLGFFGQGCHLDS